MASPNPLTRTTPLVHVPLVILAGLFTVPLVWLLLTSLQPREQVGKIPPEWLPRQNFVTVAGETIPVTPPAPIGTDRVLVSPTSGPQAGKPLLVDPSDYVSGNVKVGTQVA